MSANLFETLTFDLLTLIDIYNYFESKDLFFNVQQYEEFICFPNLIKKGWNGVDQTITSTNIDVMDISMISQLLLCTAVYVDFKLKNCDVTLDISVTKDW